MANMYCSISRLTNNTLQIQQTKSLKQMKVNFVILSEKNTNK